MSPHRRHQDCGSRISVVKAVLEVATQVAVRSLDDLGDVDQPETVPLV